MIVGADSTGRSYPAPSHSPCGGGCCRHFRTSPYWGNVGRAIRHGEERAQDLRSHNFISTHKDYSPICCIGHRKGLGWSWTRSQKHAFTMIRRPGSTWKSCAGRMVRSARIAASSTTPTRPSARRVPLRREGMPQGFHRHDEHGHGAQPHRRCTSGCMAFHLMAPARRASAPTSSTARWASLSGRLGSCATAFARPCATAGLAPMGGGGGIVEADETYFGKVAKPRRLQAPSGPPLPKRGKHAWNKRAICRAGRARRQRSASFHVADCRQGDA